MSTEKHTTAHEHVYHKRKHVDIHTRVHTRRDTCKTRAEPPPPPSLDPSLHVRVRAAILDHTVPEALSPPHASRAPGSATQDHAQARASNAAQGNTQEMEATSANLFRKECQHCGETRRQSSPPLKIPSSGAIGGQAVTPGLCTAIECRIS